MSVASEFERAERVAEDVAVLSDLAAGRLDEDLVRESAQVLLEHRRSELPAVCLSQSLRVFWEFFARPSRRGGTPRLTPAANPPAHAEKSALPARLLMGLPACSLRAVRAAGSGSAGQ
jgi:hypothetical protein